MTMEIVGTASYAGQFTTGATLTTPANAKAGDVAFVAVSFNNLNNWVITPAGWTLLSGPYNGTVSASYLFARELGASDIGGTTVFQMSTSTHRVVGMMSVWRGVDLSKVRHAVSGGTTRTSGFYTAVPANQVGEETQAIAFWLMAEPYTFASIYTMGGGATVHQQDNGISIGTSNPVMQALTSHRIPLAPATGYALEHRLNIANASGATVYGTSFVVLVPEASVATPTVFGTYAARPVERKFYGSIPKPGSVVLAGPAAPAVLTTVRPAGTLTAAPITLSGVPAPRVAAQEFLGRIGYKPRIITTSKSIDRAYERRFYGALLRGVNPVITGELAGRPEEREFNGAIQAGPATILGIAAEQVFTQDFHGEITSVATISGALAERPVIREFLGELVSLAPTLRGTLAMRPEERKFYGNAFAFGPIRYRRSVQAVLGRDNRAEASLANHTAAAEIGSRKG